MSVRWVTFGIWAAVAASAIFWGLKLWVQPAPPPPEAMVVDTAGAARGDLTRLLGADPAPVATAASAPAPVADTRFQLVGVVSPKGAAGTREGVALIAVDGQAPKAYRIGSLVAGGPHVLQQVSARGATLGPRGGPAQVSLELPPPPPPATGTLPAALSGQAPVPPANLPGNLPGAALPPPQLAPPSTPLPVPPQQAPAGGPNPPLS